MWNNRIIQLHLQLAHLAPSLFQSGLHKNQLSVEPDDHIPEHPHLCPDVRGGYLGGNTFPLSPLLGESGNVVVSLITQEPDTLCKKQTFIYLDV